MADIKFNCPHCQQRLGIPEAALGRTISCPVCGGHIALPARESSQPKEQKEEIKFSCPQCGVHILIAAVAAGKQVPCQRCGTQVVVPGAAASSQDGRETINLTLGRLDMTPAAELVQKVRQGDEQAGQTLVARGASAVPALLEGLEENSLESPKVNKGSDHVTDALVKIGHPSVQPLIAKLGKSRRAYIALGRIGSEEAVGALVRELSSVNWRRVEVACMALGLVDKSIALTLIPHLEKARKSTRVGEVYTAAGTAIAALQSRFRPPS